MNNESRERIEVTYNPNLYSPSVQAGANLEKLPLRAAIGAGVLISGFVLVPKAVELIRSITQR